MRSEDGMRFDRCIGLQDRDSVNGKIFDANVLDCEDRPLNVGDSIMVCGRAHRYDGDDNLGGSHFTAMEPFPEFETIEKQFKENLFVVSEVYRMKNGIFGIWTYVQSGETSSDNSTRQRIELTGEFATRETAIEAGWAAGGERISTFYSEY